MTRIGFVAPQHADGVRRLEAAGADSLWVGGHVASPNPTPEAMVWLARLVEQTEHATVGTATLLLPLYPPALVAKQIADLDRASGGRVVLGIGVGGEYASDFGAVGVPVTERGSRADEAMTLLRRFWTGEPVTFEGKHFTYDAIRIHPPPAQAGGPPIVVSGRRDPAMRRAALVGDGWMPYLYSAGRYAASVRRVRDLAAGAGRNLESFAWMAYVFVAIDETRDAARAGAAASLGATYSQDFESFVDRVAVVGTAEDVRAGVQAFVDAGAEHLILCPVHGDRVGTAEQLLSDLRSRP